MIREDFSTRSRVHDLGRYYITRFVESIAQTLPEGASMLDAGAGECVYKRFFSQCTYKSIDLAIGEARWNYSNLDYVGPLHDMPIEDDIFDAVLCTQVLEHLEWPRESVTEMYRVLKPGGKLYLTAPMSHPEHQTPHDFFRYTSFGLASVCQHAGFRDVNITPIGGLWMRWAYELPRSLAIFPPTGIRSRRPNFLGIALLPCKASAFVLIRLLQFLFVWLDRFDKNKNDPFGWVCVATK